MKEEYLANGRSDERKFVPGLSCPSMVVVRLKVAEPEAGRGSNWLSQPSETGSRRYVPALDPADSRKWDDIQARIVRFLQGACQQHSVAH